VILLVGTVAAAGLGAEFRLAVALGALAGLAGVVALVALYSRWEQGQLPPGLQGEAPIHPPGPPRTG